MKREQRITSFRELPGLPPYGPLPLQFSSTGQGMHRQGFVVEFYPETEGSWVGNFQLGLSGFSVAVAHPNGRNVVVISGGEAYVVNPQARSAEETFGGAINLASFVPEFGVLVLGNGLWFELITAHDHRSTSRISWDGMMDIEIDGSFLRGRAYNPLTESSDSFEVNLLDATHSGGSYPREVAS